MGRSRKARRKAERARAKRVPPRRRLSPLTRLGMGLAGILAIVVGIFLLTHGDPATERRLGRIGSILMVLGVVAIIGAVLGSV